MSGHETAKTEIDADPQGRLEEFVSAEADMAKLLAKWRDRILRSVANGIESHFLETPVEHHTAEEEGFELGLGTAVNEVLKRMTDPSFFGR